MEQEVKLLEGQVVIYENGLPIAVNKVLVDAIIQSKPDVYSKTKPGEGTKLGPKKENLKVEKTEEPKKDTTTDGKFTVEDLIAIPHNELQKLGKKLNVNTRLNHKALAQAIYEAAQKSEG